MDSEIRTDVEILKKQIFGNGVKGALTRIENLEEQIDKLEIYMEKSFSDKIQMVLEKIEERRKFNVGQALVIIGLVANIAVGLMS
jgi:hypothetical protein